MPETKFFPTSDVVSSDRILYTPSRFARASLLHLQEIGTLKALKPHTSHRDNLSSFLFFIVLSGEGSLSYDEKHYNLITGDMVFIDCSKPYSHTMPAAGTSSAVDTDVDENGLSGERLFRGGGAASSVEIEPLVPIFRASAPMYGSRPGGRLPGYLRKR